MYSNDITFSSSNLINAYSNYFDKYQKRRLISSYFSVIISITLVLFLLGVLGMLLINARKVETLFKEKIALSIDLKENVKQIEIAQLQKNLKQSLKYQDY